MLILSLVVYYLIMLQYIKILNQMFFKNIIFFDETVNKWSNDLSGTNIYKILKFC